MNRQVKTSGAMIDREVQDFDTRALLGLVAIEQTGDHFSPVLPRFYECRTSTSTGGTVHSDTCTPTIAVYLCYLWYQIRYS